MKFDDLEAALRKRPEGAPSDLELDKLVTGSLDKEEAAAVEMRAARFTESQERLAELRQGLLAFPEVDGRAQLAAIRRRLDEQPQSLLKRILRRTLFLSPLVAAATAALIMLPRTGPSQDAPGVSPLPNDAVRLKGGIKLEVVRKRGERAEKTVSGSVFHAGDSLRFVISLPSEGEVSVVGVEHSGSMYVAWPLPSQKVSSHRPAGDGQTLPGAVELDDTKGKEVLYLVHCPTAVRPTCKSAGPDKPPQCPKACTLTPFVVRKE